MSAQEAAPATTDEDSTAPGKRPSLILLTGLAAVGPFAMNIVVPAMPALARIFETPYGAMQLILSAYLAATALIQLVLGPLSDRFGRRPVILGSLLVYLAGTLVCAFAPTVEVLVAGRIVQAAGACGGLVIGRAIIRDLFSREKAASWMGYVTMAMVIAPMLAPLAGGYLFDAFGWQAMFWLSAGLGVAILAAALPHLHETRRRDAAANGGLSWGAVLALVRDRCFCGYVIVISFASAMFFTFLGGAAYVVTEVFGRPASEFGTYFIVSAVGYMIGNFLSGRFAERFGPQRMISLGLVFAVLGLTLLWALSGIPHTAALFLPMTVLAVSNGLTLPSATASAVSIRPELAGTAAGLAGSLQIGVGALGAFAVGLMQEGAMSAVPMMVIMTLGGAISAVGFVMTRRG